MLTPVAHLAPVLLGGAFVRRATLHNAAHVAALQLEVIETYRALKQDAFGQKGKRIGHTYLFYLNLGGRGEFVLSFFEHTPFIVPFDAFFTFVLPPCFQSFTGG